MSATIYQFRRPMASMDDLPAVERTRDYQCQLYIQMGLTLMQATELLYPEEMKQNDVIEHTYSFDDL